MTTNPKEKRMTMTTLKKSWKIRAEKMATRIIEGVRREDEISAK